MVNRLNRLFQQRDRDFDFLPSLWLAKDAKDLG